LLVLSFVKDEERNQEETDKQPNQHQSGGGHLILMGNDITHDGLDSQRCGNEVFFGELVHLPRPIDAVAI
jgi:hypothetical protein